MLNCYVQYEYSFFAAQKLFLKFSPTCITYQISLLDPSRFTESYSPYNSLKLNNVPLVKKWLFMFLFRS